MLGHKTGGYKMTEIYAKYDPDYLGKAAKAINDYFEDLNQRVKRPLEPKRFELCVSSVRAANHVVVPEKTKPLDKSRGWNGGAEGRNLELRT